MMPLIAKQKRFGQSNEWNLIVKRSLDGSTEQELVSLDILQENKKRQLIIRNQYCSAVRLLNSPIEMAQLLSEAMEVI